MTASFIDSHCHLTDHAFDADREETIARMKAAGMIAAITIGCEDDDIRPLRAILDAHPGFLFGAWAVHPEYPEAREADIDELVERASEPAMVAVGETGLDFYWCKEPLDWQRARFRLHIEAARRAGKPLIIHARDAEAEALEILRDERAGDMGFVMHCFCGSLETARGVVDAGGCVSFTGNLTFKKNEALRAIAGAIPLERLLIETDSPYMAPVPWRGKRCEPQYSRAVAGAIAAAKGLPEDEVLAATCANTVRLFRLPVSL
ncbi:TatD family hydrolase [Sutterella sp.]|uniref:TatD family hydrolase n=1 Tax=Sutterella sp. TaxID=1981025 RepID=UPI0026DF2208|nr:TatD family hydrolase [Sutterella sp.]MDO5530888.1 TatD family hydrolase [Sutterella sp.]